MPANPDDRVLQVHLVRHGQSTWNLARRIQGQIVHPGLTPLGRNQAEQAAATVRSRVDGRVALWSSDLVRAAQTAHIVGRLLRVPVQYDEELREQHLGSMQGLTTDQLSAEPTPEGRHVSEVRWASGESTQDVAARFGHFARRQLRATPSTVGHLVLVSHGDTIRVARALLTGQSYRDLDWSPIPNGSVHTIALPNRRLPAVQIGRGVVSTAERRPWGPPGTESPDEYF